MVPSLVPRPFLYGWDERDEGRKGLVTNSTPTRIQGISLNCEATNTYCTTLKRAATCPHYTFAQNFIHDSHLLDIRVFSSSTLTARMQQWIHVGVELFTRPFLPPPFSSRPYRKGLGTKLCQAFYLRFCILYQSKPGPGRAWE